jgi:hypothetical protein
MTSTLQRWVKQIKRFPKFWQIRRHFWISSEKKLQISTKTRIILNDSKTIFRNQLKNWNLVLSSLTKTVKNIIMRQMIISIGLLWSSRKILLIIKQQVRGSLENWKEFRFFSENYRLNFSWQWRRKDRIMRWFWEEQI